MGNTYLLSRKDALQHLLNQNEGLLTVMGIIAEQGTNMSTKLDQISADLKDIGANVTQFVATSQKAAADAKSLADAQAAQIALLTGEVAADQATIKAGQNKIDALTAAAAASAAEESSAEDTVLAAATTLDSTVQALNAPPPAPVVPAPTPAL